MDTPTRKIGRPPGVAGEETFERIRREGARLLAEKGYGDMSLRDLAARVGLSAGSLYNYITGKQELLFLLLEEHMRLALAAEHEALARSSDGPDEQLRTFVYTHIDFHTSRPNEANICISELRSLTGECRQKIVSQRDAYEKVLEDILRHGQLSGAFRIGDLRVETQVILGMITSVLAWYRPGGRLNKNKISALVCTLLLEGLRP